MDSVSGYAGTRQPRTGGKIVRPRRTNIIRTPYERPNSNRSQDLPQQNPNWISRLVYKPATAILSGAWKSINSVVFSDSSSSSSSDDQDSSSVDEDVENNFTEDETMLEDIGGSKDVIEELIMQQTFAKEEGDRLIDIIKARVIDQSNVNVSADEGFTSGETSNKAVMEAKRWFEEKKSASKVIEDGGGTPVDVAKSYMQARLPWGSPSSSSAGGMQLFKEGTPFSSSKLKKRSGSSQSWNIQDELRKVRAKATEEMLKTVSPSGVFASLETKEANNQAVEETKVITRSRRVALEKTFIMSTEGVKPSEDTTTAPQSGTGVDDSNNDQDGDFIQPNLTTEDTTNAVLALGASLDPTGDFCIPKDVFETSKEADEIGVGRPSSNGFPPSSPVVTEDQPKPQPPEDETEASQPIITETPDVVNGSDGAAIDEDSASSASHNSLSTREEDWLPGDQSLPNSASSSPGTTRVLAYSRRGGKGRGRGRGRAVRGKGRGGK